MTALESWMREARGWQAFSFQREAWAAYRAGGSGLIHATTGAGKTLAACGGPLLEGLEEGGIAARGTKIIRVRSGSNAVDRQNSGESYDSAESHDAPERLRILWLTPLRALASDTAASLREPIEGFGLKRWQVELRTGDTSQAVRKRHRERLPAVLITTPESLSILLSFAGAAARFASLRAIVVDEWHELLGTKRGVQAELCLARLRAIAPRARTWGLSATLGDVDEAMRVLLGSNATRGGATLIRGDVPREIDVCTLRPPSIDRFPWSGHLGTTLLEPVIASIEGARTTLLFTNTRSQAEIWFRNLLTARPEWLETVAIHHGSLDRDVRERVESRLRAGLLRAVVCTSSLDLGVDFLPVEQVIQVGSPKGIARLMQRAGRSGHQPGARSRVIGVPTNAFEFVEFAAARDAVNAALARSGGDEGEESGLETRQPLSRPIDVLAQHLVTIAAGDGFEPAAMLDEVRTTAAYADLRDEEWRWALEFITCGGCALGAYPRYSKVVFEDGLGRVDSQKVARDHRMSIGTITSDASIRVQMAGGRMLGTIEERFIGWLRPGDTFYLAGRLLEFLRVREMTATVRPAKRRSGRVPRWVGGRSPLSTELARAVRQRLDRARQGDFEGAEMELVRPLLELQAEWSRIPEPDEVLIERAMDAGIHHVFVFSFAGRLVHEGLTALVGHRITQRRPCTMSMSSNDYGFELQSRDRLDFSESQWREILSPQDLLEDLLACLNESELARRRFRDIARIAGLISAGFPGQSKSSRQMQASSDLFFDVFRDFDPENLLLDQAKREVLERELELSRMRETLERLSRERLTIVQTPHLSPLAFPLWAESIRTQQASSESWIHRVQRMAQELERAADDFDGSTAKRTPRRRIGAASRAHAKSAS